MSSTGGMGGKHRAARAAEAERRAAQGTTSRWTASPLPRTLALTSSARSARSGCTPDDHIRPLRHVVIYVSVADTRRLTDALGCSDPQR